MKDGRESEKNRQKKNKKQKQKKDKGVVQAIMKVWELNDFVVPLS